MSGPRECCSLCQSTRLIDGINFGTTPLANAYMEASDEWLVSEYPLNVVVCEMCGHSQIGYLVDSTILFSDYAYATSTSEITLRHLNEEARGVKQLYEHKTGVALGDESFILEIGCNDGAMLDAWKKLGVRRVLGVDPAASKLKAYDVETMDAFFHESLGKKIRSDRGAASIVIANNVFAHVPDVLGACKGVKDVLADGGLFVFEVSYLLDMAYGPLFDTIYHEHMSYHAVRPLALMLDRLGMPIISAERLKGQVGRGSLRIAARKGLGRSIDCKGARDLMMAEAMHGLWDQTFWVKLHGEVLMAGDVVRSWIETLMALGERVVGYGAAAKLTTLMHAFKLDRRHIEYIADDSKWKQGLFTPGMGIEIVAPSRLIEDQPGACVLFAWNFAESIMANNSGYRGKWVLPLPELKEVP